MKKIVLLLSIGLALFLVTIVSIGVSAQKPYQQAQKEAFALAQKKTDLITMDRFYWYNGDDTYFSLTGKTSTNEKVVVCIQQDTGQVAIFPQKDLMTETQAKQRVRTDKNPKHILELRIGMMKSDPVWEISYKQQNGKIGYYILSMKTGEWIRSIENI